MPKPCLGFAQSASPPGKGAFLGNKKNKKDDKTSGGQNRQTIPTISDNYFWRQLKQPGTTLSRCRADNSARRKKVEGSAEGMREERKDKQGKGERPAGGPLRGRQTGHRKTRNAGGKRRDVSLRRRRKVEAQRLGGVSPRADFLAVPYSLGLPSISSGRG